MKTLDYFFMTLTWTCTIISSIPFAYSWGKDGHEIVGNLAYNRLSPSAQQTVIKLLNVADDDPDLTPLGKVANWADEIRHYQHWSAALHYVDIQDERMKDGCHWSSYSDQNCQFIPTRDCADDICVVGAIANYSQRLYHNVTNHRSLRSARFSSSSKDEGAQSLKFVTHFVGDVHQPLHVSRITDRGGNLIHVSFPSGEGHHISTSLHSVWDSYIIERSIMEMFRGSRKNLEDHLTLLLQTEFRQDIPIWLQCSNTLTHECVSIWAQESLDDALLWAYLDENYNEIQNGTELTDAYYVERLFIIVTKLAMAGVRLAAALENLFCDGNDSESFWISFWM